MATLNNILNKPNNKISLRYIQKYLKSKYNIKKYVKTPDMNALCMCYTLISAIDKFILIHKNIHNINKNIFNYLFIFIKNEYGNEMCNFFKSELNILYIIMHN